jgi:anaerobic selenocysteine-containing dehydrogenase/Fe-S-cluster-containing dehydrogenase component
MNRRDFLKFTGLTGTLVATGCAQEPTRRLIPFLNPPEDIVPGKATWYATTCRQCPAGCGMLAKNRETRIVKFEGNPVHPINAGKLCARGQAALQDLYSPDRLSHPTLRQDGRERQASWQEAADTFRSEVEKAGSRVVVLSGLESGYRADLLEGWLQGLGSEQILYYEPVSYEAVREGNRIAFGRDEVPAYDISGCDFVVSVNADFLETWISPVEFARQFSEARNPEGNKAGFLYAGPRLSLTGASSDRWIAIRPGAEADFTFAVLASLLETGFSRGTGRDERARTAAVLQGLKAKDLAARAGLDPSLIDEVARRVARSRQPFVLAGGGPDAVVAANLINRIAGSAEPCMDFARPLALTRVARESEVQAWLDRMAAGEIRVLVIHRSNPIYSLPGFAQAMEKVPFTVAFDSAVSETTAASQLVFPVPTPYESWDTYVPRAGLIGCVQPTMGAVKDVESLERILGRGSEGSAEDEVPYVRFYRHLAARLGLPGKPDSLEVIATRARGFAEKPVDRTRAGVSVELRGWTYKPERPREGLQLVTYPSLRWFDGRDANKSWMLEIPDPLTMITWDAWVEVHPEKANEEGLCEGEVVEISTARGKVEAGVYISPGLERDTVAVPIGLGHTRFGRFADGIGVNAAMLTGGVGAGKAWDAAITKTGRRILFAHVDGSRSQHDRGIAQVKIERKHHASHPGESHHHDYPVRLPIAAEHDPKVDLYPPHVHDKYRWGMIIDLDRCTGCSACVAACYAENNIASVGRERILQGREMAWIRIERYLEEENPGVRFIPMLCQHCENAPCESVCPVYAPHHNSEGMNTQIYNRCIGTRFCSQNCPYKVRRFNFFHYKPDPPLDLQLNPDVTVRTKGVMEKCSFCVQRIKDAHQKAKVEGRLIREGEVVPACAQTCPTGAITFGSFLFPDSEIRRRAKHERAYQVLAELLTKPGVIYLKKIIRDDGLEKA